MRVILFSLLCAGLLATAVAGETPRPPFADLGPQVGDFLPLLSLTDLDGETVPASELAHGLTLLVTGSYTCPKTRSRYPELRQLAEHYAGKLTVALVYVIEAHPVVDPCPYKSVEDVTTANQVEGILFRQPKTMPARTKLARDFKDRLKIGLPIYLDSMDNRAWTGLGGAPNLGLLVDGNCRVLVRQAWFDGTEMSAAIDRQLAAAAEKQRRDKETEAAREQVEKACKAAGIDEWSINRVFIDSHIEVARERLAQFPGLLTYVSAFSNRGGVGGDCLLQVAARWGQVAIVELLLDRGVDPNTQTEYHPSALHLAARENHVAVIDLLLRRGATIDLSSSTGRTALDEAAYHGHKDSVGRLLAAKATVGLFAASALGDLAIIRSELSKDPGRALRPDGEYQTPLAYAAQNNQVDAVRLMLSKFIPPLVGDVRWNLIVPLQNACRNGHDEVVKLLLAANADPDSGAGWDGTCLHLAAERGHATVAKLLLEAGADPQSREPGFDQTPLLVAAASGTPETLAVLLDHGAKLTAITGSDRRPCGFGIGPERNSALHLAAKSRLLANVRFLISRMIDISRVNAAGRNALHEAVDGYGKDPHQLQDVLGALLDAGADVNHRDKSGSTCLDEATKKKLEAAISFLRSRGAKLAEELPEYESDPEVNFFRPNELVPEEEGAAPRPRYEPQERFFR